MPWRSALSMLCIASALAWASPGESPSAPGDSHTDVKFAREPESEEADRLGQAKEEDAEGSADSGAATRDSAYVVAGDDLM